MSDIVERLLNDVIPVGSVWEIRQEAAGEIERLRAIRDGCERMLQERAADALYERVRDLIKERDRLTGELAIIRNKSVPSSACNCREMAQRALETAAARDGNLSQGGQG